MLIRQVTQFIKRMTLILAVLFLPAVASSQVLSVSDQCEQQVLKYCRGQGDTYQDAKAYMECLRKNRDKFLGECGAYIDEVLGGFESQRPCLEDYLRLCGIDLVKMQVKEPQQSEEEKVHECRILKWDEFSAGCREEQQSFMDAFGLSEEEIKKQAAQLKARDKRRGLVWVKGKGVMAEAREGDLIWYAAKVKEKKILDRYPFCPEIKGKGLELRENSMGICYYIVTAPWEKELIRELETANVLKDIPDWGGGLREYSWKLAPKEDNFLSVQKHENLVRALSLVVKILDQYNSYCPEEFETEISLRSKIINNVSQPIGYGAVTCERRDYNTCRDGYVKSYYSYGYFGCVQYASCKETNSRYIDVGGGCVECEAGGCADYEMTKELGVGAICKVNYKDPAQTPPCPQYYVQHWYNPDGSLESEEYKQFNKTIKSKHYDKEGHLLFYADYEDGNPVKEYFADGRLRREWISQSGRTVMREYDGNGNVTSEGYW